MTILIAPTLHFPIMGAPSPNPLGCEPACNIDQRPATGNLVKFQRLFTLTRIPRPSAFPVYRERMRYGTQRLPPGGPRQQDPSTLVCHLRGNNTSSAIAGLMQRLSGGEGRIVRGLRCARPKSRERSFRRRLRALASATSNRCRSGSLGRVAPEMGTLQNRPISCDAKGSMKPSARQY
jgi:hypothetical protein